MPSRLQRRVLNEQEQQQQKRRNNVADRLRTLCDEVTAIHPKWRRKLPKPEHQTTFSPREMRQQRKSEVTPWTCTMHVISLTSLTLVAVLLALGIWGRLPPDKGEYMNTDGDLEGNVCSRKEVEDSQCHPGVSKDSILDGFNVASALQKPNEHISEDSALCDQKAAVEDTPDNDSKGLPIDSNTSSDAKATISNTKTQSSFDSNGTKSVDLFKAFDWVPGRPAKINDPVDDSNFPYHRLSTFRPRSVMVDGLDVVSVELKRAPSAKGTHVRAYLLDDLLSAEECDALRHVHDDHVAALSADPIICFDSVDTLRHHLRHIRKHDVTVSRNDFTKDTRCVNSTLSASLRTWGLRWSTGTGFYPGESAFSRVLDKRIEKVTGLTAVNGGAYRVVSYLQNVGYKEHTDCSVQRMKGTEDRYATVLIYLDDVQVGGHTHFPELGISVKPKKGRALVWNNMSKGGRCDPTSLHAALPVIKGTKYILQRWYYYDNFPGVSSRPPVPPIPARLPTQGLVSCDEHRHGSCRLYDIWTYDVVTRW